MTRTMCIALAAMALLLAVSLGCSAEDAARPSDAEYRDSILEWRQSRLERLTAESGYLALAGLYWLKDGEYTLGSADDNDFVVRKGAAQAHACIIRHHQGATTVEALEGTTLRVDGTPITAAVQLSPDTSGDPNVIELGDLSFYLIERGDRFGIRLRDPESPIRKNFGGIESWDIDRSYEIHARFEAYDPPRKIPIVSELGTIDSTWTPGALHFDLQGKHCSLDALVDTLDDDYLFINFRDITSGNETYGSGRFLYTEAPRDGHVVIDFNKAYNPPCAFSEFTTCPMPPLQNELDVSIRVGEKSYQP